jgi:uncharacterized protein YndB with AHSA1/START domain
METTSHEATIEVQATPDEVWDALVNPEKTRGYYYGTEILSDWQPGSRWTSESGEELYLEGELLEVDRPRRIVQTFHVAIEEPAASDAPSQVTWELTDLGGGATRVRMLHDSMGEATRDYVEGGWEHILAGLKAVVESGNSPDQTIGAKVSIANPG